MKKKGSISINMNVQRLEKFKRNAENMLANSSGHGLPNLVSDKPFLVKVIWTVSILTSISGCFFFFHNSILEYLQFDVVTNIKIQEVFELDFPAVTFCAFDHRNYGSKHLYFSNIDFCNFSGKNCTNISYIQEIRVMSWGTYDHCLIFNFKAPSSNEKNLKVTEPGIKGALLISLNLPAEFLLYFSVENNYELPIYSNIRYQIRSGTIHRKAISKVSQNTLGKPYNDCIEDNETFDSEFYDKAISKCAYRRSNCLDICFNENYSKTCNCSLSELYNNFTRCEKYNKCHIDFAKEIVLDKECSIFCPMKCDNNFFQVIDEGIESYDKNISRGLMLYFSELKYTEIVQIPKTTISGLVSNIGGTMGLFLGLSLLSLIELVEFIILSFSN